MTKTIKSRKFVLLKNGVIVALDLREMSVDNKRRYKIIKVIKGLNGVTETVRGVFKDKGVASIEFENRVNEFCLKIPAYDMNYSFYSYGY